MAESARGAPRVSGRPRDAERMAADLALLHDTGIPMGSLLMLH